MSYYEKYIKYKTKYIELRNQMGGEGDDIAHVFCKSTEDPTIFYKILLQLLQDYLTVNKESDVDDIPSSFLPLVRFIDYISPSLIPLINRNEIIDSIKIIDHYYTDTSIASYKRSLESIDERCLLSYTSNTELLEPFYDCRNYSISVILNTLLGTYDDWDDPPILIYKLNRDKSVDGHVFVHNERNGCEAIGIQVSLYHLLQRKCDDVKSGISVALFEYIFKHIIPITKCKYFYAYAWKSMSEILKYKFDFKTVIVLKSGQKMMDGEIHPIQSFVSDALLKPKYIITDKHGSNTYTLDDLSHDDRALILELDVDYADQIKPYIFTTKAI